MKLTAYEDLEDSIRQKVEDFEQQRGLVFTTEAIRKYILEPLKELNQGERHRRNRNLSEKTRELRCTNEYLEN